MIDSFFYWLGVVVIIVSLTPVLAITAYILFKAGRSGWLRANQRYGTDCHTQKGNEDVKTRS